MCMCEWIFFLNFLLHFDTLKTADLFCCFCRLFQLNFVFFLSLLHLINYNERKIFLNFCWIFFLIKTKTELCPLTCNFSACAVVELIRWARVLHVVWVLTTFSCVFSLSFWNTLYGAGDGVVFNLKHTLLHTYSHKKKPKKRF